MLPLFSLSLCLALLFWQSWAQTPADSGYAQQIRTLGINYGTLGDNLPSPTDAVAAIKGMQFGRVKIFNPNAGILTALANTSIEVVIAVPNEQIVEIGASLPAASAWVQQHVAAYYPSTYIVVILVGNEIFTGTTFQSTWTSLVPAIQNLHAALESLELSGQIKVSTAMALDLLSTSFPPSAGSFRSDIATPIIQPLLTFLTTTSSYLFVNVYPFLTCSSSSDISLSYAMFANSTNNIVDGVLEYTNLLDAQLDAVYAASVKLGFASLRIAVGETGWPTAGDPTQVHATIDNAAVYNGRLVRKALSTTLVGTPSRPGVIIPTYIFALFNENLKPGASSERNWGLLYPNLSQVYNIDLTGLLSDTQNSPTSDNSPLVAGSDTWCIDNPASDLVTLENALNFACGADGEICAAIQPGQSCYLPNTLARHAKWAFNSYWQRSKVAGASCSFDGAAILTSTDPSSEACVFPH